ncbi:hypothetical protein EDD37DRAFT_485345 [Exophiala viscosa]|uniref:uncharacterized protein n=1 Tax=Exophiala viscosa TaxID=2486360 RepID=UPI0021975C54|nr:hypothetical protein EDD37DRAFT_485345 [Exophiala viscosa]
MQSYSMTSGPPSGPKNYVFVDEHNRHKRLKVMRACEGCRRRKIKCDSATTNTWPCAACVRLKLHCVPPAGGLDGEAGDAAPDNALDQTAESQSYTSAQGMHVPQPQNYVPGNPSFQMEQGGAFPYDAYASNYQRPSYEMMEKSYGNYYPNPQQFPGTSSQAYQHAGAQYSQIPPDSDPLRDERAASSPIDQMTAEEMSEHLGHLRIGENGIAPYLRSENDNKDSDAPIQEPEPEPKIAAAFSTGAGSQIRIPPALMPSHEEALEAFKTFFRDVHPYVPVLNRKQFYDQWLNDRGSIPPLILEAIFANAGRLSDDPAQGAQWLALANKHEAYFLDSPRLSTLQALLLLLKARESAPKRGYYYRSWMTCKTAVTMAKDLELDEHHGIHEDGESCGSDPVECLIKTRIWQSLLICETMVGGPQGRTDLGVDSTSVDISPSPPCSDVDDFERSISRQFAYFVLNVRNIRLITEVSIKLKRKKDWGLDQEFVKHNAAFKNWPDELPRDLKVVLPQKGAIPILPSHFVGNMHAHYQLAIVMLHRPQLKASESFGADSQWRHHMTICYQSAKVLCRLQEAVLAQYDLTGLLCMQRGINFTIYAILTCIMLHLIALSSPDPEFNSEAKDYFVRHMRILERCVSAWPMTETEDQINALRAAFSADLNKPFELKESFPLGSPSDHSRPSPGSQSSQDKQMHQQQQLSQQQQQLSMADLQQAQPGYLPQNMNQIRGPTGYLATPPVSTYSAESKPQSPLHPTQHFDLDQTPYTSMSTPVSGYYHQPTSAPGLQWNPTPIIDQFDTAFAISPSQLAPPPSMYGGSGTGSSPPGIPTLQSFTSTGSLPRYEQQNYAPQQQQQQPQPHYFAQQQQSFPDMSSPVAGTMTQQSAAMTGYPTPAMFVTSRQWQQSVANVIDSGGLKRRWDYDQH